MHTAATVQARLEALLMPPGPERPAAYVAVVGAAGSGKTWCVENAVKTVQGRFATVVRLSASTDGELDVTRHDAAVALELRELRGGDPAALLRAHLTERTHAGWLLVVDGVDRETRLQGLLASTLPTEGGCVVVTSRLPSAVFGPPTWAATITLTATAAAAPSPLAMTLAAAYQAALGISPADYDDALRALPSPSPLAGAGPDATATWARPVVLACAAAARAAPRTATLLQLLQWTSPTVPIRCTLLLAAANAAVQADPDATAATEADVGVLERYALARVDPSNGGGVTVVHRCVQEVLADAVQGQVATAAALAREIAAAVDVACDAGDAAQARHLLLHAERLAPWLDSAAGALPLPPVPTEATAAGPPPPSPALAVAQMLRAFGKIYYYGLEDVARARPYLHRAAVAYERLLGGAHADLARTLRLLSLVHRDLGEFEQSRSLAAQALRILQAVPAGDAAAAPDDLNLELAATLRILANVNGDLGYHRSQEELLLRALNILRTQGAARTAVTEMGATLRSLATAYHFMADFAHQQATLTRLLELYESAYGPGDTRVVDALQALGEAHRDAGDYAGQIAVLRRAIDTLTPAASTPSVGASSPRPPLPRLMPLLFDLANAYGSSGQFADKQAVLEQLLAMEEASFGPESIRLVPTLVSLASMATVLGHDSDQVRHLERAFAIAERTHGPYHVLVGTIALDLALACKRAGALDRARQFAGRALHVEERLYGQWQELTLRVLHGWFFRPHRHPLDPTVDVHAAPVVCSLCYRPGVLDPFRCLACGTTYAECPACFSHSGSRRSDDPVPAPRPWARAVVDPSLAAAASSTSTPSPSAPSLDALAERPHYRSDANLMGSRWQSGSSDIAPPGAAPPPTSCCCTVL